MPLLLQVLETAPKTAPHIANRHSALLFALVSPNPKRLAKGFGPEARQISSHLVLLLVAKHLVPATVGECPLGLLHRELPRRNSLPEHMLVGAQVGDQPVDEGRLGHA